MQGTTHMAGGAMAAGLIAIAADFQPVPIFFAMLVGFIGGLFPDIDHPSSTISKKLRITSKVVSILFSHRGLFHAPALYAGLWLLITISMTSKPVLFVTEFFLIGVFSHLFLDFLNPRGIPLLLPLIGGHFHLLGIKTGGIADHLLQIFFLANCFCISIFAIIFTQ